MRQKNNISSNWEIIFFNILQFETQSIYTSWCISGPIPDLRTS